MTDERANVFTIAASASFAETLAAGLIARIGKSPLALAEVTIYVPTRRAARSFGDAFAKVLGGAALLPDFRPLGDVDEDALLLDDSAEAFALPPAISPLRRRLLLATLIQRWRAAERGETLTFAQSTALADGLCALLDEVETQGAQLDLLDTMIPGALAEHWSEVRSFLMLLRTQWPELLRAEAAMNPAARRNEALAALAARLAATAPDRPIIAAGSTGSIPATANLLGVIARLPQGALILPGLDRGLDEESWTRLANEAGHPQFGMRQLLERIGVARDAVQDWATSTRADPAREAFLRETLRPAPTTDAWRAIAEDGGKALSGGLDNVSLLEAADPAEEATAIALALREALETPGRKAALVTSDRALARRVAAELARWTIQIDDSAGRPLAHTAPGSLLCLLADAADSRFAPVPLLALLKHPLAMLGHEPGDFRAYARALDIALRGPRPDAGLAGLMRRLAQTEADEEFHRWFDRVADCLAPLETLMQSKSVPLDVLLTAHVAAAEALATDVNGTPAIWRGDAGEAARTLVESLLAAARDLPAIDPNSYARLFRDSAEAVAVRPVYNRHPRLAILGPLEARLQDFDLVVLGGLNEGSWPRAASIDPWLSRPMRKAIGLDSPERAIGLAAHDFAALASSPAVILTRAVKSEGTPTVASRWVQRLVQLARGLGMDQQLSGADGLLDIARSFVEPGPVRHIERPAPRPPVAARPRKLSVTEIETWLRDPYAIYARRILGLDKLDPLDAEIGPLERGTAIHRALEIFLEKYPAALPPNAAFELVAIADDVFSALAVPKAALALWRPRFAQAADRFVREERLRRTVIARSFVEVKGELRLPGPAGEFLLHGRADRIDAIIDDGGGLILDYKTGVPPSDKQVRELLSPQLPLEAAMLEAGGFEGVPRMKPVGLLYVRFSGGVIPVDFHLVKEDPADLAPEAVARLSGRIARFDDVTTPYLPRVLPYRADISGDYDHLARVREWSLGGAEETVEEPIE